MTQEVVINRGGQVRQQRKVTLEDSELKILKKHFPKGIIALDLETTGLSPLIDRIIEISAIKIDSDGEISIFSTLVNPEITIPLCTIQFHQITDDMVKDEFNIVRVMPQFMEFLGDAPVVAHNAKFDLGFIIFNLHMLKTHLPRCKVYDSCKFSRKVMKGVENFKLNTLATHLEIPLNHHNALDDSFACLKVFIHCLETMQKLNYLNTHSYLYNTKEFCKSADFDLTVPKHLKLIRDVVAIREMVEIEYKGGTITRKFRPVFPVSFLLMPSGTFLYAHCIISGRFKSYPLKRIKSVRSPSKEEKRLWKEHLADLQSQQLESKDAEKNE